jgi:hypothetical protein
MRRIGVVERLAVDTLPVPGPVPHRKIGIRCIGHGLLSPKLHRRVIDAAQRLCADRNGFV